MLCRKLLCIRFNFIVSKLLIRLTWAFHRSLCLRNLLSEAFELGWGGWTEAKFSDKRFLDYEKLKMHGVRRASFKMQIFNLNMSENVNSIPKESGCCIQATIFTSNNINIFQLEDFKGAPFSCKIAIYLLQQLLLLETIKFNIYFTAQNNNYSLFLWK